MRKARDGMRRVGGAAIALALFGAASCGQQPGGEEATETRQGAVAPASNGPGQAPEIPPATIPRFQTQLPRFFTYAPTLTRNAQGQMTHKEFTVRIAKFNEQQLPPGFPSTPLFGYGGDVFVKFDANGQPVTGARGQTRADGVRSAPRPGRSSSSCAYVPDLTHYRNELAGDHPRPVDPTLDWANPNNFPKPTPPFLPFPPGYPQAQIADHAHDAHARYRGGARVRRHARHLVHDQRPPRARSTCRTTTATKQQPVGGRSGITTTRSASPAWTSGSGCPGSRSCAIRPASRSIASATKTSWASRIRTTGSRRWPSIQPGVSTNRTQGRHLGVARGARTSSSCAAASST